MGKNKTKTYFVFITIGQEIGIAAGLTNCANEEVMAADAAMLARNGFKRKDCVFTLTGDLGIDEARQMLQEGKLRVKDRWHVSTFLERLPGLKEEAPLTADSLRKSLERERRRREAEEAKRVALEAERSELEKRHPDYREFQEAFWHKDLQKYGFTLSWAGGMYMYTTTYEKDGIEVSYDCGQPCGVSIGGEDVEDMDLGVPQASAIDDELEYRLSNQNYRFWRFILDRLRG